MFRTALLRERNRSVGTRTAVRLARLACAARPDVQTSEVIRAAAIHDALEPAGDDRVGKVRVWKLDEDRRCALRADLCALGHREGALRKPTVVDEQVVALQENGLFFSFPYVCPEPVLAK